MYKKIVLVVSALLIATATHGQSSEAKRQPAALAYTGPTQQRPIEQITVKGKKPFDNLRLRVVMRFPANVSNIQQATQYLLETTDYKLVLSPGAPDEARRILSRALLPQDRDDSLKTIEEALLQIAGEDTVLVIDRANKLISFEFLTSEDE